MAISDNNIDLKDSTRLRKYIIGWEKIERAIKDLNLGQLFHDGHIDKLIYHGEEDYKDDVDLFLFDSWSRKVIHFRFSNVEELKWDSDMGTAFAWECVFKYNRVTKKLVFELESLNFWIECRKIEVVSVRNYIDKKKR